jgi:hypothetical protein
VCRFVSCVDWVWCCDILFEDGNQLELEQYLLHESQNRNADPRLNYDRNVHILLGEY